MLASIPSPPTDGLHIGPLFVHAYGLAYLVGVIAAVAITSRRWARQGGTRELVHEVALWGFPAGLVDGRLYFLATSWNEVPDHWWGPFAIWEGGLGIWGGIALGTLAGLLVLRRRGADIPRFMDAAAPGLLVAQAIGRIGNYFNQELFGGPTTLPWGLHIDVAHRPAGYAQYATFHPTTTSQPRRRLLRLRRQGAAVPRAAGPPLRRARGGPARGCCSRSRTARR